MSIATGSNAPTPTTTSRLAELFGQARVPSRWVTRERPKIDRIACPWAILRFIDPAAEIHFVPAGDVRAAAERLHALPFDVADVRFSHRGERCTFDTLLDEFGLDDPPLRRLSVIIRGADTGRLDFAPEAAGLLAASLGLSRLCADDRTMLSHGMILYDALYAWARDASGETHGWPPAAA